MAEDRNSMKHEAQRGIRVPMMTFTGFLLHVLPSLLFGYVLFVDFIPSAFGSYADQRLLLSLSLIVLIASGVVWLAFNRTLIASLKGVVADPSVLIYFVYGSAPAYFKTLLFG